MPPDSPRVSTRIGGSSPPPFHSLNLGNPSGCEIQDDYDRIWMNYRQLQDAIGIASHSLLRVHQIHTDVVATAPDKSDFDVHQKADAILLTNLASVASVRVADCAPVLLSSDDGLVVAAVHAGWRGVIAGIVPKVVRLMNELKPTQSIIAAVGPCIGMNVFEVGAEVVDKFVQAFGDDALIRRAPNGKGHVDLRQAISRQLLGCGVLSENIDQSDRCTFECPGEFFSHRRDHGVTGRMAALIAMRLPIS